MATNTFSIFDKATKAYLTNDSTNPWTTDLTQAGAWLDYPTACRTYLYQTMPLTSFIVPTPAAPVTPTTPAA